ncbi:hypothetical protein AVEN_2433-1 [Araneus ventricosus]|uniref:CHHC U11-48K-type domain-containing protein n=1 Tax=Araneus ventricosus TaxID=182803 RepID=A0A4Y2ILR2_ARAVE|nr:hypothetical protein AVEN_2433-1 [Araneus ventricosus]
MLNGLTLVWHGSQENAVRTAVSSSPSNKVLELPSLCRNSNKDIASKRAVNPNHLNEIKFTCPFNATHVMPYQERDYHLLHCADKAPLDRLLAESLDKNNPFKGRTAVPSYSETLPSKADEVWEVEEEYDPTPGYLPTKERPFGAFVQPQAPSCTSNKGTYIRSCITGTD